MIRHTIAMRRETSSRRSIGRLLEDPDRTVARWTALLVAGCREMGSGTVLRVR
jgi:hypothetical protein